MLKACPAKNDTARDVNEIGRGDEIAKTAKDEGHGLAGKDVPREENAREDSKKGQLHSFSLRARFAGDEDAEREGDEDVRQGKKRQQQNAAVDGNAENEAHGGDDQAKLEESDSEIRKEFAKKQTKGTHGRDEKLLQRAALFFSDDCESRQKGGDIEKQDGREARQEEIWRTRVRIEKNFRAHLHGHGITVSQDAAERFIEADSGRNVDGLAGDGRV